MTITQEIVDAIASNQEWQDKMPRQAELEANMRTMGIDRYWNNASAAVEGGSETTTTPVRRLMTQALSVVKEGIEAFIAAARTGKAGRRHTAVKYIEQLTADAVALMTVRTVLDSITTGETVVACGRKIGTLLMDEVHFRAFAAQDNTAYKSLRDKYNEQSSHYRHKRNAMRHHMDEKNIELEEWPVTDLVQTGIKCIDIMVETTGMVEIITRARDTKHTETVVVATAETMEWIKEEHNRCAALSPVLLPTIVPPRPWTSPREGGYWTRAVRRMSIVKTYSKGYLEELESHHMPDVYDAVNAMQHTAWAINTKVLDAVKALWDTGSQLQVIPSAEDHPLPARPQFLDDGRDKEAWTETEVSQFKEWKRNATDTYTMNAKLKSLRLQFVKTLMVAEMFAAEEEIYFPHQLDFRGRCYAIPMYLNPQGADLSRGLLEFANGVAIVDECARSWLAIHLSNCYGYDKVTLEERVKWVEEREALIRAVAADPLNNLFWVDADKPWQFLAACFEWAAFLDEGFGFVSTLPIQMDGSCNGLQNFSAALRDPVGGAAVNLIPADKPQDIYQKVADVVLARVKGDACNAEDEVTMKAAQGWLQLGINRKTCKRPVMTLAYGAKEFGFKQQVFDDTINPAKYDPTTPFPFEGSGWKAADYMGKVIWDCVGQVVVAARQAMDWFQGAARVAAKEGLPVRWTTPDGLVVLQSYPKVEIERINVTFGGHTTRLTVATGYAAELDKAKQANGISPNWVHSMDASHMRATIRQGWREGLRSFSLIHDSYGCHAGNTQALADILREQFVVMYEDDVLARFKRELELQLPDGATLKDLPPKGGLDLDLVKQSRYFFA